MKADVEQEISKTTTSSHLNKRRIYDIESPEDDEIMRDSKRSRSSADYSNVDRGEFDGNDGFSDSDMDRKIRPEHIINISAELLLDFT